MSLRFLPFLHFLIAIRAHAYARRSGNASAVDSRDRDAGYGRAETVDEDPWAFPKTDNELFEEGFLQCCKKSGFDDECADFLCGGGSGMSELPSSIFVSVSNRLYLCTMLCEDRPDSRRRGTIGIQERSHQTVYGTSLCACLSGPYLARGL